MNAATLKRLAESGERVRLTRSGDRETVGTVVHVEGEVYKISTGERGRPVRFTAADVVSIATV